MTKRKSVYKGKLLNLYESHKKMPNGAQAYFEEIDHPGAALIVPFLKGKVVMIRQYRGVIEKYIWELPAGTLEEGETPYSCAKREAAEETGFKVSSLKKLGVVYTTPGFCNEMIHIYRAECSGASDAQGDPDECVDVRILGKKEVRALFSAGKILDSKTICALKFAGII
ncbi:MAG: NUDIX domain-containing protein [Candidatus Omnitrophica bacterium]|nr:NUDIX domain-containing protein [Candidatus Omnitrophota bacterium]